MHDIIAPLKLVEKSKCKRYAVLLIKADCDGLLYESTVQQLSLVKEPIIEQYYQEANSTRICALFMTAIDKYRISQLAPGFIDLIECLREMKTDIVEKYFLDYELLMIEDIYRELMLSPSLKLDIDHWDLSDLSRAFKTSLKHLFRNNLQEDRPPAAATDLAGSSNDAEPFGEQPEHDLTKDQHNELREERRRSQREEEREQLKRQEEGYRLRERDRLRKRRCRILRPYEVRSRERRSQRRKKERKMEAAKLDVVGGNYHRFYLRQLKPSNQRDENLNQVQQQPADCIGQQSSEVAPALESSPLLVSSWFSQPLESLQQPPIIDATNRTDEVEIPPPETNLLPFHFNFQQQQQSWPLRQSSPDPFAIFESPGLLAEDRAQLVQQMQSQPLQSFVDPMAPDVLQQTDDQAFSSSFLPYAPLGQDDTNLGRQAMIDYLLEDEWSQIGNIAVAHSESEPSISGQHDIQYLSNNQAGHGYRQSSVPPVAGLPPAINDPTPIRSINDLADPWQDFDRLFSKRDGAY